MRYLNSLIKQYFLCNGTLEGIEKEDFMENVKLSEDELYVAMGYYDNFNMTSKELFEMRKSYSNLTTEESMNRFAKKLKYRDIKEFQQSELSQLVGLTNIHRSVKPEGFIVKTPSSIINGLFIKTLKVVSSSIDVIELAPGFSFLDLKRNIFASGKSVDGYLEDNNMTIEFPLEVSISSTSTNPYLVDNKLYLGKSTKLPKSHEKFLVYLLECYLLGMDKIPLKLRNALYSSYNDYIEGTYVNDEPFHYLVDITHITGYSIKELVNTIGLDLKDPSYYWDNFGGFFNLTPSHIDYQSPNGETRFVGKGIDSFVEAVNTGTLDKLKGNNYIAQNNVFGEVK